MSLSQSQSKHDEGTEASGALPEPDIRRKAGLIRGESMSSVSAMFGCGWMSEAEPLQFDV